MRGSRTLFDDFMPLPEAAASPAKGRNPELMAARNRLLCARHYYYLAFFPHLRFETVIGYLAAEFFLSDIRIVEVLQEDKATLRELRAQRPKKVWFIRQWPHINW